MRSPSGGCRAGGKFQPGQHSMNTDGSFGFLAWVARRQQRVPSGTGTKKLQTCGAATPAHCHLPWHRTLTVSCPAPVPGPARRAMRCPCALCPHLLAGEHVHTLGDERRPCGLCNESHCVSVCDLRVAWEGMAGASAGPQGLSATRKKIVPHYAARSPHSKTRLSGRRAGMHRLGHGAEQGSSC